MKMSKGLPRAHLTGSRPHFRRQKMSVEGKSAFPPPGDMAFPSSPGGGAAFPQPPMMGAGAPDAGAASPDAGPAPAPAAPGAPGE